VQPGQRSGEDRWSSAAIRETVTRISNGLSECHTQNGEEGVLPSD